MKNIVKTVGIIAFVAVIGLAFFACTKSGGNSGGGGKSLNSVEALMQYLQSQPTNSPDKPIKVSLKINYTLLGDVAKVIKNEGKYVSLDFSKSALTTIPENAFVDIMTFDFVKGYDKLVNIILPNSVTSIGIGAFLSYTGLINITIPNNVTSIGGGAFADCKNLTSVTFKGTIPSESFGSEGLFGGWASPFDGDLLDKFYATDKNNGTPGTYTTTAPVNNNSKWTKQ